MPTPENPVEPDSDTAASTDDGVDERAATTPAEESVGAVPGDSAEADAADADAVGPEDSVKVELAERTADLQRVQADFVNYRKRTAREVIDARASGKAAVVKELLVVVDDLDRARSHGDLESGPLKSVSDKFGDVLARLGLKPFGAEGDDFDPSIHEAVQHEGEGSDSVLGAVLRQGYEIDGKVIRNAMVAVIDRPAGVDDANEGSETSDTKA